MKFSAITLATLTSLASASLDSDISSVSSLADGLASQVAGWNSQSGLIAALGIQEAFPGLVTAVNNLKNDLGSATDSDINAQSITSLVGTVVLLLNDLTAKAADFSSVGAGGIVKNDIQSVQSPAVDIAYSIVSAISGDCAKIQALTPALGSYAAAFSSADAAYGVSTSAFPTVSC